MKAKLTFPNRPCVPTEPAVFDDSELAEPKRSSGDTWIHSITGLEYRWDGKAWVSTGRYPYGLNPMDF